DLARYEAKLRKPMRFRFEGFDVYTTPAPSSGPVLAEMALLAEIVGREKLRASDTTAAHWIVEIEKRAFRDRNRYLGDPAFGGVREKVFTDPERLRRLAASIDPRRATPTDRLAPADRERPTTTHFSVLDADGMAVSVTT